MEIIEVMQDGPNLQRSIFPTSFIFVEKEKSNLQMNDKEKLP